MWLRDEPFHAKNAPIPEDYPYTPDLSYEGINLLLRNSIGGLQDEGYLDGDELEKINDEQQWCFQAVLNAYTDRLNNILKKEVLRVDARYHFEQRLSLIDDYLNVKNNPDMARLLNDIELKKTAHHNMAGPDCQLVRKDIEKGMLPEPIRIKSSRFGSQKTPIRADLIHFKQGYEPHPFFVTALLDVERKFILRLYVDDLTKDDIYATYYDMVESKILVRTALKEIQAWLINEKGYTLDEVKSKFDITLEYSNFTRSARNYRKDPIRVAASKSKWNGSLRHPS
jgi:hypothetical protein